MRGDPIELIYTEFEKRKDMQGCPLVFQLEFGLLVLYVRKGQPGRTRAAPGASLLKTSEHF